MRPPVALGVVVLLGALVSGCASETEKYCGALEEQQSRLAELALGADEPGEDLLQQTLEIFRELQGEAPGDIADEWSTLTFAYEGMVDAFDGVDTPLAEYDPAEPPADVSEEEAQRITDAAEELRSPRVTEAADGIQQHARDVCKTDLSLTGGGG